MLIDALLCIVVPGYGEQCGTCLVLWSLLWSRRLAAYRSSKRWLPTVTTPLLTQYNFRIALVVVSTARVAIMLAGRRAGRWATATDDKRWHRNINRRRCTKITRRSDRPTLHAVFLQEKMHAEIYYQFFGLHVADSLSRRRVNWLICQVYLTWIMSLLKIQINQIYNKLDLTGVGQKITINYEASSSSSGLVLSASKKPTFTVVGL